MAARYVFIHREEASCHHRSPHATLAGRDHAPNGLTYSTYPYNGQYLLAWVIWVLKTLGAQHPEEWNNTAVFVTWDD